MNPTATFLFGGFLLLMTAAAVSALAAAINCAEDGYEDALGFHHESPTVVAGAS